VRHSDSFLRGVKDLFLRRKDGKVVRILAVEDPTPAGGTFNVRYFEITFFGGLGNFVYALRGCRPKIDKSGNVPFALPIKDSPVSGALFLYTPDGIKTVVANGDPAPLETNANLAFFQSLNATQPPVARFLRYTISDAGTIAFTSQLSTGPLVLLQIKDGKIRELAAVANAAPAEDGIFRRGLPGALTKSPRRYRFSIRSLLQAISRRNLPFSGA